MNNGNGSVKIYGTQRIGGVKIFEQFPLTPATSPADNYQAANKKYVDDSLAGGFGGVFTKIEVGPGAENADGNWRIYPNGAEFLVQYNNGGGAGNWVTTGRFTFP